MYIYKIVNSLALCMLFFCIVFVVNRHGINNRIFASGKSVHTIDAPEKAYYIWKEKNVRGRTLILFDNYPHTIGYYAYKGLPQLNHSNLIEFSIFENIIRRIYFIVPENGWDEFRNQKFANPIVEAGRVAKGVYLYNQSGIPIIAMPPTSLPPLDEEVLVYINNQVFKTDQALALLAQKRISSDIIISYESTAK
jgi:hypothetical protein